MFIKLKKENEIIDEIVEVNYENDVLLNEIENQNNSEIDFNNN